jgi:uncharacterized membrane protein
MMNPQFYKGAIDASGCISNAWEMIKPNYWLFFGISLLAYVLIACIPCLNVILVGPVMGGVYYTSFRAMRGEPVDFGMMFKGFERFVPLMVVGLIQSIPSIIYQGFDISIRVSNVGIEQIMRGRGGEGDGTGLAIAGGYIAIIVIVTVVLLILSIVWAISFAFAIPILVDNENMSPIEALKLSARAGWSNVGGMIVLAILGFLVALVGMLALCIGVLFVMPIIIVAWAFAYRQVFPDLGPPPAYRYEPPSPDAYQGSFGQGL